MLPRALAYARQRLREPSTWTASGTLWTAVAFGVPMDWALVKIAALVLVALCVTMSVWLPERGTHE